MSTADEFLELQRLLAGIKSISTKLESIRAHGMTPRARVGVECDDFMNHVETKSDTTETTAFDPVEKRLYVATLLDTLRRCKVLHATNEAMIVAAEKRMISLGCTAPLTSAACPISNSSFSTIARNYAIYESTLKSLGSPPLCYVLSMRVWVSPSLSSDQCLCELHCDSYPVHVTERSLSHRWFTLSVTF